MKVLVRLAVVGLVALVWRSASPKSRLPTPRPDRSSAALLMWCSSRTTTRRATRSSPMTAATTET